MKQFLLSTGFLFSFFIGFGQCPGTPDEDLIFFTQEDIDNFLIEYPNCTELNVHNFRIEGEDIYNLDGLEQSQLSSITVAQGLEIRDTSLTTLSGFQNIDIIIGGFPIYGGFAIEDNDLLTSLDGLERIELSQYNPYIYIRYNNALVDIDALSGIELSYVLYIYIYGNPVLESIEGLRNVTESPYFTIAGEMLLDCNVKFVCFALFNPLDPLISFSIICPPVFQACTNCGTQLITLNSQSEIDNFPINYPDCIDFNYGVVIDGSDIIDLTPLSGIISITDGLTISNTSLESLDGLSGLQNVDEILLINNPLLTDISEFEDISIEKLEHVEIVDNVQLNSCGLSPFCTYLNEGGEFTITNNGIDCNSGLDVATSCGLELNQISGTILYDYDNTGCESGNYNVSNLQITAASTTNTYSTLTDEEGSYSLLIGTGETTITIDQTSLPDNYTATPSSIVQDFIDTGNEIGADFCLEATTLVHDLSVSLIPLQEPRPGFEARYIVSYTNQGTYVESGDITLHFDNESVFFVESVEMPVSTTDASLTWEYDALLPFESRSFTVTFELFTPPTLIGGEILSSDVIITAINGDDIPENNTSTLNEEVVNSFDPNDKQVLQGERILEEEVGEYLDYIVRFQNTGTADAINVEVRDELSTYLDWGSFRMLDASHDYRIEIENGNQVAFIFEDIYLPPEEQDEEGSNGFIAFQIRSNNDLVLGDVIENTASIFFDFNEPIITNTVVTTVSPPCPTGITLSSQAEVNMFAVNFSDCTEIDGQLIIEGETITDLSPLSGITSVIEGIIIRNNTNLVTLAGLEVNQTAGDIQILNNSSLESLIGLEGLTSMEDMLIIRDNTVLTSLSGLNNLINTDDLSIINNDSLENLQGLNSLISTDGDLSIEDNDSLENLGGLMNYSNGDGLSIVNNVALTSMDGVGAFGTLTLSIRNNPSMVDILSLNQVENIGEILEIVNNDNLTSLEGLDNLNSVGFGFTLSGNEMLTDITAISDLLDPSMYISINNNSNLLVCDINVVCSFISNLNSSQTIIISDNASGCNSIEEVEEACLLGVNEELLENAIEVYPNPIVDVLNITVASDIKLQDVEIFSIAGKKVMIAKDETLDFSKLSSGIYFARIITNQGTVVKKIVKR